MVNRSLETNITVITVKKKNLLDQCKFIYLLEKENEKVRGER